MVTIGLVLILILMSSGCLEDDKNLSESDRFLGNWETKDGSEAKFYSNGDCVFGPYEGTWELKENMLLMTIPFTGGQNTLGYSYNFTNDYKTLRLMNAKEEILVYYKQ